MSGAATAEPTLPPGPPYPAAVQSLAWWTRPIGFLERNRARYGKRYSIRLLGQEPFVVMSDPDDLKAVLTADPEVLHPGEGARILEPVVGANSVILLDEDSHLEQRKLMLPAFHGERIARLAGLVAEVAEREADRWPRDVPTPLHSRLQALTLEVILRAVFGLPPGERLEKLRVLLTEILDISSRPVGLIPQLRRSVGGRSPWDRFLRLRAQADEIVFALIDERRAARDEGDDVLAMLLGAEHEDGSPMSNQELRDELMTLLVAGHETTASALAWAFERLAREPHVLARLTEEIDSGDGEAYLTATIQETLRCRPVLPNAAPRLAKQPVEIGGWLYPEGVSLVPNAYLVHHDPDVYPDPYAFRPERFLDNQPGTYTWIPFGGGRRRCLGASFAMLEMKAVLRAVLAHSELHAPGDGKEPARRRSITISPRYGAPTILRPRRIATGRAPRTDLEPASA